MHNIQYIKYTKENINSHSIALCKEKKEIQVSERQKLFKRTSHLHLHTVHSNISIQNVSHDVRP